MASKIRCVIFDFDNTLVKSKIDFPAMKIAMARAARKLGLDFGNDDDIPYKFTAGAMIDEAKQFGQENGTNLVSLLWSLVEEFEAEGMKDITIYDGVIPMLRSLKEKKVLIALLTNNSRNPTIAVLERFNLLNYFDLIIAREDVKNMKPDTEGIDLILEELSSKKEEAFFVGDSWVDGLAANNSGIRFVLFRKEPLDPSKHKTIIWKHIHSMNELLPLLDSN